MPAKYLEVDGEVVRPAQLTHPGAIATAKAALGGAAALVECRQTVSVETVLLDIAVERPQRPLRDIQKYERIGAAFLRDQDVLPEALAMRASFPLVPHLNLRECEFPRSLCLYDQAWGEVARSWTAQAFIGHIQRWLSQTSRDELHERDQTLEPLIIGSGLDLVVPAGFGVDEDVAPMPAQIVPVGGKSGRVWICSDHANDELDGVKAFVMYIEAPTQTHGVIRHIPKTLGDVCALVDCQQFSLINQLREAMQAIPSRIQSSQSLRQNVRPVFVIGLPKARQVGGEAEAIELKAFITMDNIETVGVDIGAWCVDGKRLGRIIGNQIAAGGDNSKIIVANVQRQLTRDKATVFSGLAERDDRRIVAIGLGALGSQVAMNLARSGSALWTLVDDDAFMPHNTVRHALDGGVTIGFNKAECVSFHINALTPSETVSDFVPINYISAVQTEQKLIDAISKSDLVLDASASVAVARKLADDQRSSRTASLFLSPSGLDLVLLMEDEQRRMKLDDLEMLYYGATASMPELSGHLAADDGVIRYGGSCRDVSRPMNQATVGTMAGIGAAAISQSRHDLSASIRVWRMDPQSLTMSMSEVPVRQFVQLEWAGWRVRVNREVLSGLASQRDAQLPKETGGTLFGGIDYARRCIHVVLALPSPSDSEEWPNMYVRGVKGLKAARDRVANQTMGNLDYLGEWHSHPRNASTLPSNDDRKVFEWIRTLAEQQDRPAIMMIAGEGESRLFVGDIDPIPEPICLPS